VLLAASASVLCASAAFAIYQLTKILFSVVRDSEYEADKLITAVSATIHSDSPGVVMSPTTSSVSQQLTQFKRRLAWPLESAYTSHQDLLEPRCTKWTALGCADSYNSYIATACSRLT
jgi:hypothetical protein